MNAEDDDVGQVVMESLVRVWRLVGCSPLDWTSGGERGKGI
jgi:hypothetical protein